MSYELKLPGRSPTLFDTEADAVAVARQALLDDPDAEPEIRDTASGNPVAPGASQSWREELKSRTGF